MPIEKIMIRFNLSAGDIDKISNCIMNKKGLKETAGLIDNKISLNSLYVVAKSFCEEYIGEDISITNPKMFSEKAAIDKRTKKDKEEKVITSREMSRLKKIRDDLILYDLERRETLDN